MELILINENKLKVMLSAQDMETYRFDCDHIDYDDTHTRSVFWTILDEAKKSTGFEAAVGRVYVQVYPSRDGGCEMFITKLDAREVRDGEKTQKKCFLFADFDDLALCCKRLERDGLGGGGDAFFEEMSGRYYLCIEVPRRITYLSEYAEPCRALQMAYVEEHGVRIAGKNACKILSLLA